MTENKGDLISRSELKKAFNKWWGCDDIPSSVVEDIIDESPSVEPSLNLDNITDEEIEKFKLIWQRANSKGLLAINEERPQGEWIYNQYDANPKIGNWHCSICHTICYEMKLAHDNFNYCPNCGAKMKGGEE